MLPVMQTKTLLALMSLLFADAAVLNAQTARPAQPATPATPQSDDSQQNNRFWQASLPGGHYMVALDRISAISRHKYVLDGTLIVDEVTVDAMGQALARFYFIKPITDEGGGTGTAAAAARAVDRGRELLDRGAQVAGTNIHEMVVKKFPETTHARTIEYRLMSEEQLGALHNSVRTAWDTGKGRRFAIK